MKVSTLDVIKALPLKSELKEELIRDYDSYPLGKQTSISEFVWDIFDDIYQLKLREYTTLPILEDVEEGKEPPEDFAIQARQRAAREMDEMIEQGVSDEHLKDIRHDIQDILLKKMKKEDPQDG